MCSHEYCVIKGGVYALQLDDYSCGPTAIYNSGIQNNSINELCKKCETTDYTLPHNLEKVLSLRRVSMRNLKQINSGIVLYVMDGDTPHYAYFRILEKNKYLIVNDGSYKGYSFVSFDKLKELLLKSEIPPSHDFHGKYRLPMIWNI